MTIVKRLLMLLVCLADNLTRQGRHRKGVEQDSVRRHRRLRNMHSGGNVKRTVSQYSDSQAAVTAPRWLLVEQYVCP